MKFSHYAWELYKKSEDGKKIIKMFSVGSRKFKIKKHLERFNNHLFKKIDNDYLIDFYAGQPHQKSLIFDAVALLDLPFFF